jgi:hypothetical protein
MQDWSIPLAIAAVAFLAVVLWRFRPFVELGGEPKAGAIPRELQAKLDAVKSEAERALLLCDAAAETRTAGATALYLRAMRADPASVEVVERAVGGLSHRPRALESVLWRRLGAAPWTESKDATRAALDALRVLYEGPRRNAVRARAMTQARDAMGPPPA